MGERFYGYFELLPGAVEQSRDYKGEGQLVVREGRTAIVYVHAKFYRDDLEKMQALSSKYDLYGEYMCGGSASAERAAERNDDFHYLWRPAAEEDERLRKEAYEVAQCEREAQRARSMVPAEDRLNALFETTSAAVRELDKRISDGETKLAKLKELRVAAAAIAAKCQRDLNGIAIAK